LCSAKIMAQIRVVFTSAIVPGPIYFAYILKLLGCNEITKF